jgi:carbonic anhydrase/acetyltransferase-like protein (isoleucine patch superfamily)
LENLSYKTGGREKDFAGCKGIGKGRETGAGVLPIRSRLYNERVKGIERVKGPAAAPGSEAPMQAIQEYFVASNAVIRGDVVLSPGANVWYNTVIRADLSRITLGPRVNLQDGCLVHSDTDQPQVIEEGVVAGHGAVLHGRRIGRDTLVGIGAKLLSGCEIGEGCVIGAGAIVTEGRHVPPRSLVLGVPGRVIRAVTDEEVERTRAICAHYLEMAQRYARGAISR